jgi:hypothetical protein
MKKNYLLFFLLLTFKISSSQTTVTISADKDNTIYSQYSGNSNGSGQYFFVGRNSSNNSNSVQRALLHFNLSGIPAGAVITSATVTLYVGKSAAAATGIELRKLSADWGEGTSDAAGSEGPGTAATTNDATWSQRFFPSTAWSTPGGDFSSTVSASVASISANISSPTQITLSGSNVVSDVQQWVTNSTTNFGWLIKATDENVDPSVKRFISRNNSTTTQRPSLSITYSANLPVTLNQFSGSLQNNNALLQWQTATEINNQYFAIQHSSDGVNFSQIGRVDGNGNSTGINSYTYTVPNVTPGKHYYRIVQYDFDGNMHYSQIIVLASNSKLLLEFYPNPVISSIRLVTSTSLDGAPYTIMAVTGQTVKKGILNNQQIKVDELSAGQYWLTIRTGNGDQYKSSFIKR